MPIINKKYKYAVYGLIFVFFSIALLVSCLSTNNNAEAVYKYDNYLKTPPDIRVLLHKNIKEIEIEINQPYRVSYFKSNEILSNKENLTKSVIYLKSGNFRIKSLTSGSTLDVPATFAKADGNVTVFSDNGFVKLNKLKYSGKLIFVPDNNNRFSILEEIGVEEYLPGVIEGEMPIKWNDDALQAQAIAIRTYAIYQRKVKSNALYHINLQDLAYKGSYMNQAKTKEIVEKSRGTVMVYDWKLFPGYFHSTCGGHTEDINLVFNLKSIPPLSGVNCGYCNKSKYYHWTKKLGKNEIESKLNNKNSKIKRIRNITTEKVGPGGHCSTIKIDYAGGTKRVNANDFRLLVGPNNLRSTSFKVKKNGSSFIFDGSGWGHGVGLCQYGTQDMAKSGIKWFDILRHYYPEIDLVKIY
ncbi:sporulation protein and related proteins [Candidatus Scalindua japonica]|uniref:Sporulation protein and related proteins n=1 Tax=Candidatus Scalindua japonica TaxID=1284222 RepID=A0A286TV53_9BACT|nr:SpoIID/LytB domain-containing protein [Candidatus Scalindua japonica]GAX59763.1 sporulation protein and related proteins [Candidatus Scalindua japonica]